MMALETSLVVICPYCLKPAVLEDSAVVYNGRSYGMIWRCAPCDAYVGTHKGSADHRPLGRLVDALLRKWKIKAHEALDPLWIGGAMTRRRAYERAAELMGLPEIHIGEFDVEQCKRLIEALAREV